MEISHVTSYMNEAYATAPRWRRFLVARGPHFIARRVGLWNAAELHAARERDREHALTRR